MRQMIRIVALAVGFFLLALTSAGPALAQAAQMGVAALTAQKPALEAKLDQVEADRLAFRRDLAAREETCLARFFSGHCIDQIRSEFLTEMRRFDLRREEVLQAIRSIDAEIRALSRADRLKDPAKTAPEAGQQTSPQGAS
jgi:hypothetical protein